MKYLIIGGADKFGREVCACTKQTSEHGVEWRIRGFLDNRRQMLDSFQYDGPVLASPEICILTPKNSFVSAVGYGAP